MQISVSCPKCSTTFDASSAVQRHVEHQLEQLIQEKAVELRAAAVAEVRKDLGDQLRAKSETVVELERKLKDARKTESDALDLQRQMREEKEQLETEIKRRVEQASAAVRKQAEQSVREEVGLQLDAKNEELKAAKDKVHAAQLKEIDLHKQKADLEEREREFKVDMHRQLSEERSKLQDAAARKATEVADLKLKEQDDLIQQLKKQLSATQQKLEQGSQQAQGEAQELVLDQRLRAAFPVDDFREVEKGAEGADILQVVRDSRGRDCGSILWESKRTRNWSPGWLQKLAEDRARENASVAAIASQALPKEIDILGQVDGVWVCSLAHATVLAALLRQGILDVAEARQALEGQTDKMSMLYRYLTGADFRSRAMAVVQPLARVLEQLDKERRAMTKIWAERERLVSMAFDGMTGMHKDVQRIAGVDLAMIPGTEDGVSELADIAGESEDEAVREIENPWNQPDGKDEELERTFLEKLKASGGYSGNLSMRRDLGWDEGSYERVKVRLVESGVVVVGPGRGGTVRILEASAE